MSHAYRVGSKQSSVHPRFIFLFDHQRNAGAKVDAGKGTPLVERGSYSCYGSDAECSATTEGHPGADRALSCKPAVPEERETLKGLLGSVSG